MNKEQSFRDFTKKEVDLIQHLRKLNPKDRNFCFDIIMGMYTSSNEKSKEEIEPFIIYTGKTN